jgi:hypothetical protein
MRDVPGLHTAVVTLAGASQASTRRCRSARRSPAQDADRAAEEGEGRAGRPRRARGPAAAGPLGGRGARKPALEDARGPAKIAATLAGAAIVGQTAINHARDNKALEELDGRLAKLTAGKNLNGLKALRAEFARFSSFPGGVRKTREELDRLIDKTEAVQKLGREGVSIKVNSKVTARGASDVAFALKQMRTSAFNSVEDVQSNVKLNMRLIANTFDTKSLEGKQALARNFNAAAGAVKRSMHDGTISTRDGLKLINSYMRAALAQYGITGKAASNYINGRDTTGKDLSGTAPGGVAKGAQRGMITLGRAGAVGPDSIPLQVGAQKVLAAPGEDVAVINRHQRAVLDRRLADMGGLPGLFRQVNQEHVQPMARFARGGLVALGRSLQRQGYQVSENPAFGGVHPVHQPGSLHYSGNAIDVNADGRPGGEAKWLDRLAGQLSAAHWHYLWRVAGHFDHLHVDTLGGGGAALQAAMIKRVIAKGVSGTLQPIVQGALDATRRGAQARLDQIVASSVGESGEVSLAGGPWETVLAAEAKQRGWNAGDWRWIVGRESGGRTDAKNPTSTAFGLGQLLDSTYGKYGGGPGSSGAEQIHAMARYIADRYGNPTAAKAFWEQHNWYQRGGLLDMLGAQGGVLASAAGAPNTSTGTGFSLPVAPSLWAGAGHQPNTHQGTGRVKAGKPHKRGRTPPGGRLKARLKKVTEIAKVNALGHKLDVLHTTYSSAEREQAISQEQQTRTAKVRDLTDGDLLAAGVAQKDLAQLRQSPDQEVEVRDEAQIAQHVGELDVLLGMQDQAGKLLGRQRDAAKEGLRKLGDGIRERMAAEEKTRAKAAANIKRIKALMGEVKAMDEAISHAKKPSERRALRRQQATRRHKIGRELDGLRDENQWLVGSRSVNADLGGGAEGRLKVVRSSLDAFRAARRELAPKVTPVTGEIPLGLDDVRLSILELLSERGTWTNTKPPPIQIPEPQTNDAEIAGLLRQQLDDARRSSALERGQLGALTGFAQLLGGRFVGSFAHGSMRVPETGLALVHRDETITPDPQGPYGSQLAGGGGRFEVDVTVRTAKGEVLELVDARVRQHAGRAASEQTGRRTRVLIAAPGGR